MPSPGRANIWYSAADANVAETAAVDFVGEARAVDVTEVAVVEAVVLVGDHDRERNELVRQTVAGAGAQPVPVIVPVVGRRACDASGTGATNGPQLL